MGTVNSVNFLGAAAHVDSEAEYRLIDVGKSIQLAKQATAEASLLMKGSYGQSVSGQILAARSTLDQTMSAGIRAQELWSKVARDFDNTRDWLDGYMRPDYSNAFRKLGKDGAKFHKILVGRGISAPHMKWAFKEIREICEEHSSPECVLQCIGHLARLADDLSSVYGQFFVTLQKIRSDEPEFDMYTYVFDHLALKAEKPELMEVDEAWFVQMSTFDIFYEAVEQLSREAHTLVPGTHDQILERFSLKFTPPLRSMQVLDRLGVPVAAGTSALAVRQVDNRTLRAYLDTDEDRQLLEADLDKYRSEKGNHIDINGILEGSCRLTLPVECEGSCEAGQCSAIFDIPWMYCGCVKIPFPGT